MKNILHHLFLPHESNNHKAKILHHTHIFFIAILLFFFAYALSVIKLTKPTVLGTKVSISTQDLLQLTNEKRKSQGQLPLLLNNDLSKAAQAKATYMISHNFWSHTAPDGRTPWEFFKDAKYSYIYAGENLARGFTTSSDVVDAWMDSPEHRENILSPNYQDIGFAIVRGNLTGEKDTVLIVQMFGSKTIPPTTKGTDVQSPIAVKQRPALLAAVHTNPAVNSQPLAQIITLGIVSLFLLVLLLDMIIIGRKQIVRLFEHNPDHFIFLSFILIMVGVLGKGVIY